MEDKVAVEVAEQEVQGWCERFGITLDPAKREPVERAVCAGRLSLDEVKEEFLYKLRRPVALENGGSLAELRLHEPTAGQIRDANKGTRDETEASLRLLSAITGQPLGLVERIGQKDLTVAGTLFYFFA